MARGLSQGFGEWRLLNLKTAVSLVLEKQAEIDGGDENVSTVFTGWACYLLLR
jgi:hypothetical protein